MYATKEKKVVQKSEEIEDLRIRRTRKLLQQAFIELTAEKGFAALTVRDITERAMVNRSTFYRHYLDKYDLLEQYMDDVYELIADEGPLCLIHLLQHIQQFADFYRVMLGGKGDPVFTQRFRKNTEMRFRSLFELASIEPGPNEPPIDLRLSCIAYAGVGATVWWLEQERPCPPEQLACWLGQLTSSIAGPGVKPKV